MIDPPLRPGDSGEHGDPVMAGSAKGCDALHPDGLRPCDLLRASAEPGQLDLGDDGKVLCCLSLVDRLLGSDVARLAFLAGQTGCLPVAIGREHAEDQVGLLVSAAMLDLAFHAPILPSSLGSGQPVESS